jgi:hypothetical protein
MENFYAKQVTEAGDRSLLRQAYTSTFGHCNFSPAELVAGVLALSHRVTTGSWDAVADPASLNRVAAGLNLGAARFAEDYSPGSLTGAALDRYRDPVNALESRMLHGTTKPQVTALRRTLTTCHANLAPGQPRLP